MGRLPGKIGSRPPPPYVIIYGRTIAGRWPTEQHAPEQRSERPWLPLLYAGGSGGCFVGSDSSDIADFGGRADFDVAALWQVENLGFGNSARQREQRSATRQPSLAVQQMWDRVAAEVTQSYQRIQMRSQQIEVTRPPVESAVQAVRLNMEGIQGGELRPIEIQQAIGALAAARAQYLDAVIDYNASQLQLLRAIGVTSDNAIGQ